MNELISAYAAYQTQASFEAARNLMRELRRTKKVEDAIDLAIKWSTKIDLPIQHLQLGYDMSSLRMYVEAETVLENVLPNLASNADFDYQARLELAFIKYRLGNFQSAHTLHKLLHEPDWCEVWTRLTSTNRDNSWFLPYKHKVLYDQSIDGKSILICAEGGVGDLLQLSRYTENLRNEGAASIYYFAPLSTQSLLQHSGLPITVVTNTDGLMASSDIIAWPFTLFTRYQKNPYFPRVAGANLGLAINYTLPAGIQEKFVKHNNGRRRIGLVWRSETRVRHEPFRSMDLQELVPLLASVDADFFSLQVGTLSETERQLLEQYQVVDLAPHLRSFEDSAHVLEHLDLLLTVDSAPAHLAGIRQRPVWLMLAQSCDYRWYDSLRFTPWYSSMLLYRQTKLGNWQSVIAEMIVDLSA
jgi:hypothetical protein